MKLKAMSSLAAIGIALLLASCGSESNAESQTYGEVLRGLRAAALAERAYGAAQRAEELDPAKREVIRSFCEFAWQMGVNREAWKLSVSGLAERRIRSGAFRQGNAEYDAIVAALGELRGVIPLEALTGSLLKRYVNACRR